MSSKIKHIHHVGHVVKDMGAALDLYQKLGFICPDPSYPTMAKKAGEAPEPFGAANTHATFLHNFIEIVTVVDDGDHIPSKASLVPIQVPPDILTQVLENIDRTVSKVSKCLSRFEGTHILCFCSLDTQETAHEFDQIGVTHSGVNTIQRPMEKKNGKQFIPLNYLEIDGEDIPEGRLAVADNPSIDILQQQSNMKHPNGAIELAEVVLCVADDELDDFTKRYRGYLGQDAQIKGVQHIFILEQTQITIVPESCLNDIFPSEAAPALPAFVGYAVVVRDITAARKYIEKNGFPVVEIEDGNFFVPSAALFGTSIIFKQKKDNKEVDRYC